MALDLNSNPSFDNLILFDPAVLQRTLKDIWALLKGSTQRIGELERQVGANNVQMATLNRGLNGADGDKSRLDALQAALDKAQADAAAALARAAAAEGRAAALEGRLGAVEGDRNDLLKQMQALDAKLDRVADTASLSDELLKMKGQLKNLAPDLDELSGLRDLCNKHTREIADLNNRITHMTLDDLVDEKARQEHRVIIEDNGQLRRYDGGDENVDPRTLVRTPSPVAGQGSAMGAQGSGASATHSGNTREGDKYGATRDGGARDGRDGSGMDDNYSRSEHIRGGAGGEVDSTRALANMGLSQAQLLGTAGASHEDLLHSYSTLNSMVNAHAAMLEQLLRQSPEAEVIDNKADLAYCDELFRALNDRLKQLADVSNRNVTVLGNICNSKADMDVIDLLKSDLSCMMEDDSVNLAAGKIHFRCLSCDRFRTGIAGPATQAFRAGSSRGLRNGEELYSGVGGETVLYGSDSNVYKGRRPPSSGGRSGSRLLRPESAPPYPGWQRVYTPKTPRTGIRGNARV